MKNKISITATLFGLIACGAAFADEPLKIGWDDSQTGVHYRLEQAPFVEPNGTAPAPEPVWTVTRDNIQPYAGAPRQGDEADDQLVDLGVFPTGKYVFRVFAVLTGSSLESDPSQTLRVDIKPGAPGNPRRVKIVLQSSSNLKDWKDAYVHTHIPASRDSEFFRAAISLTP
jgi:uncharacterized protein YfaQ (DUF2300 family)